MARIADSNELIPSPQRLITSLRDLGYDFAQAVADIVDNSIEAKATRVDVTVEFEGNNSWVRIADNGKGMSPEQLRESMRYGAKRDYGKDDLGKFGLGLKTASLSQCQQLIVASRHNRARADISACSWDINHIKKSDRWEIISLKGADLPLEAREPLLGNTGTVVVWHRLDRILGYEYPYGDAARKRLSQMCREVEAHLGMVFHRFLTGENGCRRTKMSLNGNPVVPWDPFCRSEKKTKQLSPITVDVEHEGIKGKVPAHPYILPHQEDFSSPDAFRLASGPANWNQQQGFYIYRSNRMIQSGGWCNLRTPDEHTKLARISLDFSPRLDEAFKINVAKMRVQMPSEIRELMRDATTPVVKMAREIYDRGPRSSTPTKSSSSPQTKGTKTKTHRVAHKTMTLEEWNKLALRMATRSEKAVVKAVIERMIKR